MGDFGKVQGTDFDLNEFNVRYCVTPEFPGGTWAYFLCVSTNGTPLFPYHVPRRFWGNPTGTNLTSLAETVTTNFIGGPNASITLNKPAFTNSNVTLSWSSVDGGAYQVVSSTNLPVWSNRATNLASQGTTTQLTTNRNTNCEFFTVTRTAISNYDAVASSGYGITSVSPTSANRNTTFTLTINISSSVNPPPQTAPINSVTIGAISATSSTHVSSTQVTASFTIPSGATTGAQTVSVTFPGPPGNPTATVTYTFNNFTIN